MTAESRFRSLYTVLWFMSGRGGSTLFRTFRCAALNLGIRDVWQL